MIFHDRIETITQAPTGEYDAYGNPIVGEVRATHRAEVQPLSSAETVAAGQLVETRYRAFLGPNVVLDPTGAIYWDGNKYEVEGDVETHKVLGRPHHKEFVMHRVTG